jgi:Asp-tRNA(Asn)/Glu-tRNA(Gln) amidotransferase A subunit family amidase
MYVHAKRWRRILDRPIVDLTRQFDALIAPSAPDRAPRADLDLEIGRLGDPRLQIVATAFGLPAIGLPIGIGSDGLPSSFQLIGQRGQDAKLLDIAHWYELEFGLLTETPLQEL